MCVFQFPLTFCPHQNEQNCDRQTRFRASKYTNNAFAAGALHGPRWEILQRSPRPQLDLGKGRGKGWPPETAGLDPPLVITHLSTVSIQHHLQMYVCMFLLAS